MSKIKTLIDSDNAPPLTMVYGDTSQRAPTMRELLEDLHDELLPGVEMVIAWDCDECGTVMDENELACTNCGYTYKQKCERWPD